MKMATCRWSTRAPIWACVDQALAARNNGGIVIAQVKRVAPAGALPPQTIPAARRARRSHLCWIPSKCRPRRRLMNRRSAASCRARWPASPQWKWDLSKVIARRAAMTLQAGETVNLGLRHIGACALYSAGRRPAWRRYLGDRTRRCRRFAPAGFPIRLRLQPRSHRRFARSIHLLSRPAASNRTLLSFMEVDAAGSVNVSRLAAKPHVTGRHRRLHRYHRPSPEHRLQQLLHRRRAQDRN